MKSTCGQWAFPLIRQGIRPSRLQAWGIRARASLPQGRDVAVMALPVGMVALAIAVHGAA
jgi:hypothetical protein